MWDIGAHHGSVALCASRRVGAMGQVHAFEPAEVNRTYLRRHVRWNGLKNVVIQPFALSSSDGEGTFGGNGSSTGYALHMGDERVDVRTAATIVASGAAPPPTFAKFDVEDLADEVLAGAASILGPETRMILSVHSARSHAACLTRLRSSGYEIIESRELRDMPRGSWRGDPDMVCFGPSYDARERAWDREMLRVAEF